MLVLDYVPAHPSERVLVGDDGCIQVMFLLFKTTSVIWSMDQSITTALKRGYYFRQYLDDMLVACKKMRMRMKDGQECSLILEVSTFIPLSFCMQLRPNKSVYTSILLEKAVTE